MSPLLDVVINGEHVMLCHYAMRVRLHSRFGALHIVGHMHGRLPGDRQSCDCWRYAPITLVMAKERMARHPAQEPER